MKSPDGLLDPSGWVALIRVTYDLMQSLPTAANVPPQDTAVRLISSATPGVFGFAGAALSTFVIQGLTLRPLMLLLKLSDSGEVEKEVRLARRCVAQVALGVLNAAEGPDRALRDEQAALLRHAEHGPSPEDAALLLARRRLLEAQRQALVQLRAARDIGDDAFHVVEEELDAFEFYSERRLARLLT